MKGSCYGHWCDGDGLNVERCEDSAVSRSVEYLPKKECMVAQPDDLCCEYLVCFT